MPLILVLRFGGLLCGVPSKPHTRLAVIIAHYKPQRFVTLRDEASHQSHTVEGVEWQHAGGSRCLSNTAFWNKFARSALLSKCKAKTDEEHTLLFSCQEGSARPSWERGALERPDEILRGWEATRRGLMFKHSPTWRPRTKEDVSGPRWVWRALLCIMEHEQGVDNRRWVVLMHFSTWGHAVDSQRGLWGNLQTLEMMHYPGASDIKRTSPLDLSSLCLFRGGICSSLNSPTWTDVERSHCSLMVLRVWHHNLTSWTLQKMISKQVKKPYF